MRRVPRHRLPAAERELEVPEIGEHPHLPRERIRLGAAGERPDDEDGEEERIIEREDAQRPARVEIPEEPFAIARVQEDPRDEEPAQHEEEVDAGPTEAHDAQQRLADRAVLPVYGEVQDHHRQHRDAPDAIERR